ncbi:MAG: cytochrome c3 family protein [Deltaproteobacteria bacterium]|nr:cytochrome c3 family protein [Candidatus Anaeroferrophillus wilburensis]MBN2888536.1 cytochrome c3 family protein [Deltaproteobacteria bacterium]
MKKLMMALSIMALVLVAVPAFALPGDGIVGSPHDMNVVSNPDGQGRVCAFCHTPHHALDDANADYLPLWSHTMTTQTFTPYDSVTLDAAVTDVLAGPSRLCMSCHDGAIAVDQHYAIVGTDYRTGDSWGNIAVGQNGDLTNDHPIGFDYTAVAAVDDEIRPETTATTNPAIPTIADLLLDGQIMTCSSCHDVHNTDNNDVDFLINLQAGSAICLTCHDK